MLNRLLIVGNVDYYTALLLPASSNMIQDKPSLKSS